MGSCLRLKHFPLTDIPESINSELSSTQVRPASESTAAFLPHLVQLNSTRHKCDVNQA